MIEQWILIASFVAGFLRNFVHQLAEKEHFIHKTAAYIFGILYGILFAYMVTQSNPIFAALWFGVIIALIIANKMNGFAHILGLATLIAVLGINGSERISWIFLIIFTLVAFADEVMSKRQAKERNLKNVLTRFIGLQLISLLVSLFTGIWILFTAVVLYDIGFIIVEFVLPHTIDDLVPKKKRKKHNSHDHEGHHEL